MINQKHFRFIGKLVNYKIRCKNIFSYLLLVIFGPGSHSGQHIRNTDPRQKSSGSGSDLQTYTFFIFKYVTVSKRLLLQYSKPHENFRIYSIVESMFGAPDVLWAQRRRFV